jgi:uncharacterized protein YjbI with pentapeptide repeats
LETRITAVERSYSSIAADDDIAGAICRLKVAFVPLSFLVRTCGSVLEGWAAKMPIDQPVNRYGSAYNLLGLTLSAGLVQACCRGTAMRVASSVLWIVSLTLAASGAFGADFTRAEVQSMLAVAPATPRPNFAGRSLAGLDLHDLDFTAVDLSGADLSDADLRGTKLVAAKLVGAKLPRARLNLAWIMRADFSHADLSGAILETLIVSAGMETLPNETARFVGANLSGAKVTARFSATCTERTFPICAHLQTCVISRWA